MELSCCCLDSFVSRLTMKEQVFDNVLSVFSFLEKKGWMIKFGGRPSFEAMTMNDGQVTLVPMPTTPLFRGQNCFYPTCKPTLYRKRFSDLEQIEFDIQIENLKSILEQHPDVQEMRLQGLRPNYMGIAQHYGLKTPILDLTNDALVAAFFATTECVEGKYRPIVTEHENGVIYFLPFESMLPENDVIMPIGLEVLPRPAEQGAYGYTLAPNEDLNEKCNLRFLFKHNAKVSEQICEWTNNGATLFTNDPMVDKIENIKKRRLYTDTSLKIVAQKRGIMDVETLKSALESVGCQFVVESPFKYTEAEIKEIRKLSYQTQFYVTTRLVYIPPSDK